LGNCKVQTAHLLGRAASAGRKLHDPVGRKAAAAAVNISTRMSVGTGNNVLIGGFIVTGTAPKKVIIRAVGLSLSTGSTPLEGRLQDTVLELHASDNSLITSNDWRTTQEQAIIDSTVARGTIVSRRSSRRFSPASTPLLCQARVR
jgi:hypothetical protein